MSDLSSDEVKKIVESFSGKTGESNDIIPILAHASVGDLSLKLSFKNSFEGKVYDVIDSLDKYSYVLTLIEKHNEYHLEMKAFLIDEGKEYSVLNDKKNFPKTNEGKTQVEKYIKEPLSIFQKGERIKLATFKNSPMTEEEFNDWIELWRTQTITN